MSDPANADGAVKTHVDNFNNKVAVATYHTITKEADGEWDIPSTVTSDAATVATGNASVDTATTAAVGDTKSLTISTDIFTGGSGDDIINATLGGAGANVLTYNANDRLDGGEGNDSIYIEQNAAPLAPYYSEEYREDLDLTLQQAQGSPLKHCLMLRIQP